MTMDHLHQMFIDQGAPDWLNWFGRPVAAMFLFLCAEGFYHTRSKKKYLLRFLGGFLLMAVMNRVFTAVMFMESVALINNIFGTLFMAVYYMWMIDYLRGGIKEKRPARILRAAGGLLLPLAASLAMLLALRTGSRIVIQIFLFIPTPLSVEGGPVLVFIGAGLYLLRGSRLLQMGLILAVSAVTWFFSRNSPGSVQWLMGCAVIPLLLYNGKRGRGGIGGKYFFYIFYPAHIYLLYCAAWFLRP
jgi:hypothetical protein